MGFAGPPEKLHRLLVGYFSNNPIHPRLASDGFAPRSRSDALFQKIAPHSQRGGIKSIQRQPQIPHPGKHQSPPTPQIGRGLQRTVSPIPIIERERDRIFRTQKLIQRIVGIVLDMVQNDPRCISGHPNLPDPEAAMPKAFCQQGMNLARFFDTGFHSRKQITPRIRNGDAA